jgi:hypothetical protein
VNSLPALLGLTVLGAVATWALMQADWLVRTGRTAALIVASVAVLPVLSLWIEQPAVYAAWLAVGAALWAPILARHPLVLSLSGTDGSLAKEVDRIQGRVATASGAYKANRIHSAELAARVHAAREEGGRLVPPDLGWKAFLDSWLAELEISERMALDPGGSSLSADATALRAETHQRFAALVQARGSFWRW